MYDRPPVLLVYLHKTNQINLLMISKYAKLLNPKQKDIH